jgi:hypothetical protein
MELGWDLSAKHGFHSKKRGFDRELYFFFFFFFLNQFIFRNTCPRQSPVVTKNRYSYTEDVEQGRYVDSRITEPRK